MPIFHMLAAGEEIKPGDEYLSTSLDNPPHGWRPTTVIGLIMTANAVGYFRRRSSSAPSPSGSCPVARDHYPVMNNL